MAPKAYEFPGGREDHEAAHAHASQCSSFRADDPDECVSDSMPSCYNCRYRRWTPRSFTCMKHLL
jgi:hypothetical protein